MQVDEKMLKALLELLYKKSDCISIKIALADINMEEYPPCDRGLCDESEALGISVSAFNAHKEKMELKEALKKGRASLVLDLRSEMIKKAFKHTLETKKTYVTKDENGSTKKHTEITMKEVDGDTGALHLLLKNYDKDNWKNDWDSYELKQAELELKKKLADDKDWNI